MISLDEMTDYFTHVFQTMAEAEGAAPSVPIDQLARATAEDCFAVADANGDGSITFDEFRVWYSGLDGGGALSAVGGKAPTPSAPAISPAPAVSATKKPFPAASGAGAQQVRVLCGCVAGAVWVFISFRFGCDSSRGCVVPS